MTQTLAKNIRKLALQMVHDAKASHIGSGLSIADIVAVLYGKTLQYACDNPNLSTRDRFILSKGHACVVIYAALASVGFFEEELLKTYGKDFSNLMNHISHKVAGVEFSTGSLGHGLPFAVGKALAAKKRQQTWRTYAILSDGEMAEGSNWEAIMFAAHHRLDNLCLIIDYNKLQSLTTVANTLGLEPLADKMSAFGWRAIEVDGHDHGALIAAFEQAASTAGKPTVLIAHTVKGKGVSFMENKVEWHYRSPNTEQLAQAFKELGV